MPDIHVVYYSRTGTTNQVARSITDSMDGVTVHRIRPRTARSYPNWLARSFLPGSTVPIEPVRTDFGDAQAVFLGTPKWTFSCPPMTQFVRNAGLAGVPTGLFVTPGGFDEKRYTRHLATTLYDRGADVRATLLVQRDSIDAGELETGIDEFVRAVRRGDG